MHRNMSVCLTACWQQPLIIRRTTRHCSINLTGRLSQPDVGRPYSCEPMQGQERSNADSGSRGTTSEGEEQAPDTMLRLDQQYGAPQQMQYQQFSQPGAPYTQQAGAAGQAAQQQQQQFGSWVKYYIQRVTSNINHVLFYCVDGAGMAKLAVVGTDVKLSGHFVYASVSDMTDAVPLRCTNRQRVLEWLAELGAVELAEDHEVTLPQLAPHHWQQLHSSNPMTMKPKLDRNYTSWKEDSGVLPDGRHYKHFHLVDASSGHERLAVVGEDSARQDRRYTYKALEDVGGYCFENGKAVSDWLDFVVGRVDAPPGQMRRDKPLDRRRSKKKRGAGATTEEEGEGQDLYNSGGGRIVSHRSDPLRLPPRYGSGGQMPGSLYAAPPPSGMPLPFDQQHPHMHSNPQQPMGGYGPGALQPLLGPPIAGFGAGPAAVTGASPAAEAPVDMAAAVRAAGEEVRQLFAIGGQPLLTFVTHVPNAESVEIVSEMARRLSSFVDALGLTGMPGSSAVNAAEVKSILQFLTERPASLKLLETTGIGRPVALLGCMHDVLASQGQQLRPEAVQELQPVHDMAQRMASMWQDMASTAHKLAIEALEGTPRAM